MMAQHGSGMYLFQKQGECCILMGRLFMETVMATVTM